MPNVFEAPVDVSSFFFIFIFIFELRFLHVSSLKQQKPLAYWNFIWGVDETWSLTALASNNKIKFELKTKKRTYEKNNNNNN